MADRSLSTAARVSKGYRTLKPKSGYRLLVIALLAGKGLDALSTIVVLSLRDDVYEQQLVARRLIAEFGVVEGSLLVAVIAVVGVAVLAESGRLVAWLVPDPWVPNAYVAALRAATYGTAAAWYAFLGVHNFLLLA